MTNADFRSFQLPCTDPERMDDWFIPERSPLAPEDEDRIRAETLKQCEVDDVDSGEWERRADRAIVDATTELRGRRRRAIEACLADCPMAARRMCLDQGLKLENLEHGIWGGYTDTERRQIRTAIQNRKKNGTTGAEAVIEPAPEKKGGALNPS